MIATESVASPTIPRAPRPVVWLVLVAFAAAVAAVGAATTLAVLASVEPRVEPAPRAFWFALCAGAAATGASLGLRALRWIFLLRRAGIRIPLRDASIGYLAGFSLLLVPLLAGEAAARAWVHRARAGVPVGTTCVLVYWERLLDAAALAFVAAVTAVLLGVPQAALLPFALVAATCIPPVRRLLLRSLAAAVRIVVTRRTRDDGGAALSSLQGLTADAPWTTALLTSIVAWALPALALWAIAASWGGGFSLLRAQYAYAASALSGGLMLAPGGVLVVGGWLISYLIASGLPEAAAAVTVMAVRLVTAGLATVLGGIFVWMHVRTPPLASEAHFDDIAHAYDAQIPPAQREALLARKTALMAEAIARHGAGRRGLDAGCGQGWYVGRLRQMGFDVRGIDASEGQVARARAHVDDPAAIAEGSVLRIASPDAAFDFVYTINVLHHLASIEEQRAAVTELTRVLRPGGLLFVHEINTRNVLFRFYMGYVFPSLNCIDEGTERWLLPGRLGDYTKVPVVAIEYFTFLPEFVPASVLRMLRPLEAWLERSRLRAYSAHYMAVLQKAATPR